MAKKAKICQVVAQFLSYVPINLENSFLNDITYGSFLFPFFSDLEKSLWVCHPDVE